MLWAYFDGSADEKRQFFITLGGIISSEVVWPEFEKEWMAILASYDLKEFHMVDAMARPPRSHFEGWKESKINRIVNDLTNLICKFAGRMAIPKGREFLLKSCTISMRDYWRVKKENVFLRRPEAICVNSCFGSGLPPDPANLGQEYQTAILYFDDNEPFLKQIKPVWEKRRRDRVGWPSQIQQILPLFNEQIPALQAVDIIAWTANQSHMGDDRARMLFPIIPLHGGLADFYDYERIKKEYGSDAEGTDPLTYKALPPRDL